MNSMIVACRKTGPQGFAFLGFESAPTLRLAMARTKKVKPVQEPKNAPEKAAEPIEVMEVDQPATKEDNAAHKEAPAAAPPGTEKDGFEPLMQTYYEGKHICEPVKEIKVLVFSGQHCITLTVNSLVFSGQMETATCFS